MSLQPWLLAATSSLLLATLPGCASTAATPTAVAALADPCTLVTAADVHASFVTGVKDMAKPLASDPSSRSCSVLIHDINGDEHLVVAVAANGPGAIANVCDRGTRPEAAPVAGIGSRACWNPDDLSVSALQHGVFYSVAIIEPLTPADYQTPLENLLATVVKRQ